MGCQIMKFTKSLKCALFSSALLFSSYASAYSVGISFPTQNEDRWYEEGFLLDKELRNKGFDSYLFFAGDLDINLQKRQIRRLIDQGVDTLIIAAVDTYQLNDVLKEAKAKNIKVIAYDRLIMNTKDVDYYSAVDNEMSGELQGEYIIKHLNPDGDNIKRMEVFTGSLDDANSQFFLEGAMKKMSGFMVMEYLLIPSKEEKQEDTAIEGWSTELANKRMGQLIEKIGYGPNSSVKLDAVLCPNDAIADGVIFALKKAGFTKENMPIITGCDASREGLRNIDEGLQAMTIYKTTELVTSTFDMVVSLSKGQKPEINDSFTYDNGAQIMNSFLSNPEEIDYSNYKRLMKN